MRSLVVARRKRSWPRAGLVAVAGALVLTTVAVPAAAQDDGSDGGGDTRFHPDTAAPAQVSGLSDEVAVPDPAAAAVRHLASHPDTYAIDRPGTDLTPLETITDRDQHTVRFAQSYRGIPVLGAHYLVHMTDLDGGQRVTGATGRFFTELDLDTTAAATEDTAVARAEHHVAAQLASGQITGTGTAGLGTITGAEPAELRSESHGLVVLPGGGTGRLAYHVTVRVLDPAAAAPVQREVYLDADAAYPVFDYSGLPAAAATGTGVTAHGETVDIELDSTETGFALRDLTRGDGITTWDARGYDLSQVLGFWPPDLAPYHSPDSHVDGELTTAGAVDAHVNAGHVYDYYAGLGRDGLDGAGAPIDSVTGVTFFGTPFVNAFWDGEKMIYGGGDDEFHVLSADLDVVGHEMTHGVIEHSADLVYAHQSGALNEAIADYFGNAIDVEISGTPMSDPDAGLVGEDLCRTLAPRDCALRDLDSGLTTADYVAVTYDHDTGGVHLNSTVFAGVLWQIRKELGGELADRLVYKALTEYLTPLDGFADGRAAVEAAAEAIGLSRHEQWTIAKLFWRHGIYDGWEQRTLRLDGTELLGPVTATATFPNATGGVWTTSNSDPAGTAPYQVFAGRTDGRGEPVQLSDGSDPDVFHVHPATDGESVVWAAWGSRFIRIMRAPADGSGTPEEIFRTGIQLSFLTFDGQYVAWQATDGRFGSKVFYLDIATGELAPVDNTFFQNNFAPQLHDGKLLYLNRDQRQPHRQLQPVVKDLATGEDTVLPLPDYDPEHGIGWLAPRMSDDYVVTFADTRGDEATSLLRYPAGGGEPTVLIDETSAADPRVLPGQIDITGSSITFSNWPGPTVPKVYQLPVTGGKLRPVSCSAGMQPIFDADAGRRVVFLDGAAGYTALVARDHPRGACGHR